MLDKIGASLTEHYREIVNHDGYVSAEKVKNAYLGMDMRCETLQKVFERHNADYEKMYRSGSRSWRVLYRYRYVHLLLSEFIKQRYNRSDMALKKIQPAFITDFEFFLRTEKGYGNTTIWMYMMPLRNHCHRHTQRLALPRPLFRVQHRPRRCRARVSDERRNKGADGV